VISFDVDVSELVALGADLGIAAVSSQAASTVLVSTMTRLGAEDAQRRIRGQIRGVYLPHYPSSITSESSGLRGEYGPDAGHMQGGMGTGVEYGSVNTGPRPHLMPSADALEQIVEQGMVRVVARVLW
jgi:hypothetical protein